jgi:hypothetical protein
LTGATGPIENDAQSTSTEFGARNRAQWTSPHPRTGHARSPPTVIEHLNSDDPPQAVALPFVLPGELD